MGAIPDFIKPFNKFRFAFGKQQHTITKVVVEANHLDVVTTMIDGSGPSYPQTLDLGQTISNFESGMCELITEDK